MIWTHAQKIAASYPEKDRAKYVTAAKTLRIPYWDWASNPDIPRSMTTSKINVNTPTGMQSIDNPLYQYKFDPSVQKGFPEGDSVSLIIVTKLFQGLLADFVKFNYSLHPTPILLDSPTQTVNLKMTEPPGQ